MCNAHPRYLDFGDSQPCFVVFEKGKKLRDHAMRHFTSTLHWDGGWSKWAKGFSNIAAALDELRELGCPYQQDGFTKKKRISASIALSTMIRAANQEGKQ